MSIGMQAAIETRPMDEGHIITFMLGPHSPIIVGDSELRFLPDDPGLPVDVRSVCVADQLLLHGEVPFWRLPSFVFTNVRPGYDARIELAARGPLPHGIRGRWMARFMVGDYGRGEWDGVEFRTLRTRDRPSVRYEPVTQDAIKAAVLDVLAAHRNPSPATPLLPRCREGCELCDPEQAQYAR